MKLLDRTFDINTTPVTPASQTLEQHHNIAQFIYYEAQLLDERRFDEWLDLWTNDGRYWVPRHHNQANPFEQISMFWEDSMLRETRVRRITNERNWSQQPPTRTAHTVSGIRIEGLDHDGRMIVSSALHIDEYRIEPRQLGARVIHKLEMQPDGRWKIHLKRVNLVDLDAIFANLEIFL